MFCCTLLNVHSSIAIILMGKRELIALLNLSSWCLLMVGQLFLTVQRGCLQFVIVVIPDHTHLLFFTLQASEFRLYTSYFTLQSSEFTVQTSHFIFQTSYFTLHTSQFLIFKHMPVVYYKYEGCSKNTRTDAAIPSVFDIICTHVKSMVVMVTSPRNIRPKFNKTQTCVPPKMTSIPCV